MWEKNLKMYLIIYFILLQVFYIVNRVTEFYFSFQNIYLYFNKQVGILCYLIPHCFINYVCTAFWAKLTVFTYQGRNAVNKNGVNRSWGILNCRQPWLWGAGMCHKLTRGQYVLLTLIINVIFLRRKKAVNLMKDTDEHLYGWPTMHRYAQMQFSLRERWTGKLCCYITPLSEHE